MVENLKTRAVIQDKIAGVWNKVGQAAKNVGNRQPTWESPVSYKVVCTRGLSVRKGTEDATEVVFRLSQDQIVTVIELSGRKARIISPVEGWVTVENRNGVELLRRCMVQRQAHQANALENLFEQRRTEQMKSQQGNRDYRSIQEDRRKNDRRDPSQSDSDRSDRDDRRPRRRDDRDEPSTNADAFVPRLAPPGSSGGPAFLAPPPAPAAQCSSSTGSDQNNGDLLNMFDASPKATAAPQQQVPFDAFDPSGGPPATTSSTTDDWADFQGFNPNPSPAQFAPQAPANPNPSPAQFTPQAPANPNPSPAPFAPQAPAVYNGMVTGHSGMMQAGNWPVQQQQQQAPFPYQPTSGMPGYGYPAGAGGMCQQGAFPGGFGFPGGSGNFQGPPAMNWACPA